VLQVFAPLFDSTMLKVLASAFKPSKSQTTYMLLPATACFLSASLLCPVLFAVSQVFAPFF
jgi:hypothetical protein